MNFGRVVRALICPLLLLVSGAPSFATPLMPVDEIRRGMTGVGRTVFHGTRIDTFDVEVLGVLKNVFGPKTDIILARLSGDPIEKTGGIAGMSGSPVYVDGRLIGAVAYGWSFSIEPIMGITPIQDMLDILDRPSSHADVRSHLQSRTLEHETLEAFGVGRMAPVQTPVYLSGFASEVVPGLKETLGPFGLLPVQGGGGLDADLPEPTLEPGAALGVQLVRGDFNITAIGTLTHIEGDRLVGFGHPMLFSGATRLPMTTAFIHDVVASQFQSFKLGVAVKEVGAIVQDRAPGIGGMLDARAKMLPTRITVASEDGEQRFEMEVLEDRALGPVLIQSAVVSSVIAAEKARGEVTVRTAFEMTLPDRPTVRFENVYAGPRGLGEGVMGVTRPLQLLMQNPFTEVDLSSVSFDLKIDQEVKAARIGAVTLGQTHFEPGDEVDVEVRMVPYLSEPETIRTTVTIPEYFREGQLTLRVSSARAHAAQTSKRVPGRYRVENVDAMLRVLEEEYSNDQLILELQANRPGATLGGVELSSLPPSVIGAMRQARRSSGVSEVNRSVLDESVVTVPYVVSGQQVVFIKVGSDGPSLRFSPSAPAPPKKN